MRPAASVRAWGCGLLALGLLACAPRLRAGEAAEVRASPGAFDYLAAAASARVVGFGAPLAGASPAPGLAPADVEALVREHGFRGLALDVDATAARALDAYVGGAAVDAAAALRALGDPGLASPEVLALLGWLRAHNREPGAARVRIFGLDPRDGDAAAAVVIAFLERVDPAYVPTARSLLAGGEQLGVDAVLRRLDERREAYARADAAAWVDARQQAEVTAQARRMAETWEYEAREFARARNAEWALAQLGGGKLLISANNRQVAAEVPGAAPSMGNFLRQWLGADYRALGELFAGGQVRGEGCARAAVTIEAGSLDAALAGASGGWIDLRGRTGLWTRPQRIGGETLRPALAFDALLVIPAASPATPLDGACPTGG